MNKINYFGLILGTILGGIAFIVLNNILYAAAVLIITYLYFAFILSKRFKKYNVQNSRFHECYLFINTFIISLSINSSIPNAFESACNELPTSFLNQKENMKDLTENEKLLYLQKYFKFHVYKVFLDIVFFWMDQGGNIITMSENLSNELRDLEEYLSYSHSVAKGKLIEFSVLWFFCLLILSILRFALSEFYIYFLKENIFIFGVLGVLLLVIFSIELITKKMTSIHLKGWEYEE
jgi:hypothetical protein